MYDYMRRLFLALTLYIGFSHPSLAREVVQTDHLASYTLVPGTILVKTSERKLYLIIDQGVAIRYNVAVGKQAKQWFGQARISGKFVEPAWSPPEEVKRDRPWLPEVIQGGIDANPMGARALTLDRDQYAIHGTSPSMRKSIGTAASYGCIRMLNEDVVDLFERVKVGTQVIVSR